MMPKLTLNLGVRYEYYGVQHNNNRNLDSNYYYGPGSDYYQQIRSGQVFTTPNSPIGRAMEAAVRYSVAPRRVRL